MESQPKGSRIGRRDFLEISAAVGGGVGLAILANSLGWLNWLQKKEVWTTDKLEQKLVKAVNDSIE